MAELLRVAAEHLERSAFTNARQAVQDALKLLPNDVRARQFLIDVDTRQKELLRQRQEQERLYQSAQAALLAGKIELALENLEHLAQLTAQSGDTRDRADDYKELHRRVRATTMRLGQRLSRRRSYLTTTLRRLRRFATATWRSTRTSRISWICDVRSSDGARSRPRPSGRVFRKNWSRKIARKHACASPKTL